MGRGLGDLVDRVRPADRHRLVDPVGVGGEDVEDDVARRASGLGRQLGQAPAGDLGRGRRIGDEHAVPAADPEAVDDAAVPRELVAAVAQHRADPVRPAVDHPAGERDGTGW